MAGAPGMSPRPGTSRWCAALLLAGCATSPPAPRDVAPPPITPAPRVVVAAPATCPRGQPCSFTDRDGDGFLDDVDDCPDDPGVEPDGCAIADRDADGVRDPDDPCPGEPESDNAFQTDGCPEELPPHVAAALAPYRYTMAEFESVARTKTASKQLRARLGMLGAVLREHPELRVEIGFHTDSREPHVASWRSRSGDLSGVARRWLIEREKIDASRLEVMNHGPDEPVDTNRTEEGRANNRRLEFTLFEH